MRPKDPCGPAPSRIVATTLHLQYLGHLRSWLVWGIGIIDLGHLSLWAHISVGINSFLHVTKNSSSEVIRLMVGGWGALSSPLLCTFPVVWEPKKEMGEHKASLVVAGLPLEPGGGRGTGADGFPSPTQWEYSHISECMTLSRGKCETGIPLEKQEVPAPSFDTAQGTDEAFSYLETGKGGWKTFW